MNAPETINALIAGELHDYDPDAGNLRTVGQVAPMSPEWHRLTLNEFRDALITPKETDVLFFAVVWSKPAIRSRGLTAAIVLSTFHGQSFSRSRLNQNTAPST